MKKVIGIAALVVVLAVVGALLYLRSNLDRLVAEAIERHGSQTLGVPVRVGSVSIDVREGRGSIRGLRVANPEGYSRGDALRLGEITVGIDARSVTSSPIVVPEVTLLAPEVEWEVNARGGSNIEKLLENAQAAGKGAGKGGKPAPEESAGEAGEPVRLSIGRFRFEEGRVQADLEAMGGDTFEAKLPPVRMSNLSGTPDRIGEQVAREFLRTIVNAVARAQARRQGEKLIDEKLEGEAGEAAKKLLDRVLD